MASVHVPKVLQEETLFAGRRVTLRKLLVQYGHAVMEREIVSFGKTVAVLPVKDGNKVVLIRQWRAPINDWIYEIPAGVIESGEDPEKAAQRELREETGYIADKLTKLFEGYVAPGYSTEYMYVFLAEKLRYVGASPEAGEIVKTVELPLEKVIEMIKSSEIRDLKTIAAISYYLALTTRK